MIGLSLAYLQNGTFSENAEAFLALQSELALEACELHMEAAQFTAGFWYWDNSLADKVLAIRKKVRLLGIHLPYLDLNPISANPLIAGFATDCLEAAIVRAAELGADYVAFHARGKRSPASSRQCDLDCWRKVVARLSDFASEHGLVFCLENADDVRSLKEIMALAEVSSTTSLCLDIGHLFERVELPTVWERVAARCWDRWLPWTPLAGTGLPFYDFGDFTALVNRLKERLFCVHVHNHNGRLAHQPLSEGKAGLDTIWDKLDAAGMPVILEADYRWRDLNIVKQDIMALRKVIE